jgi:hypothetical protein
MKSFTPLSFLLIASVGLFGWEACRAEEAALLVTPTTPDINIKIRSHDRRAISLPSLQYAFQFAASCVSGLVPDSILLSVADTRKRVSASNTRYDSDAGITITVPAGQIAPLTVEGFCLEPNDRNPDELDQVTVRGVLSAQASLLCSGENDQEITYASQSLDVTLTCDAEQSE